MKNCEKITSCRVCGDKGIEGFFDLGLQPLANSLLKYRHDTEILYPLSLSWCKACSLVQLNETIDPRMLFSNYVWVTGTSKGAGDFARRFFEESLIRFRPVRKSYVLEVASNDGTFLRPFKQAGYEVLGVDPAENIARIAIDGGVPTECAFFSSDFATKLLARKGSACFVFARNVLPHVAHTRDFVNALRIILADDGTLAVEVHYAKTILEELHYDSIYHEHLCYFTLRSLTWLLRSCGLYVFDVASSPISGGSILVYARKQEALATGALTACRATEDVARANELASWRDFARRSTMHKRQLSELLGMACHEGIVVGWGASARSSTLLNFCGITDRSIKGIADQNTLKQGLFTAGTHIPIIRPEEAMDKKPQTVFILAWNFKDEIIERLEKEFGFRGNYLMPLPGDPILTKHGRNGA
jgi:C-methyltransferase C-terminal domain/Methyltransferase domain/Putative zinc binding domain